MRKLKSIFIVLILILIAGCTNGVTDEDINKIATNPIVKQQINEIIKSNCFSVDKVKEGGVIHYFVTPRDCNYTIKYNYNDLIISNSTEDLIIINGENNTNIIKL